MRIACYNFLMGGSRTRHTHWRMLARVAPDILLTQESRIPPRSLLAYHIFEEAVVNRWGTGVFAQVPVEKIPVAGFEGWVVGGELQRAAGQGERPLRVFSVHCPAGEHGYVRTMHRILDQIAGFGEHADLVIGGDFNVVTGYRGDAEKVRMSKAERVLLDRIRDELGLIACWQHVHPGEPLAQTLRWSGNRRMPYHCDGIFVPAAWRERLRSCEILNGRTWRRLSDHFPVVAELEH